MNVREYYTYLSAAREQLWNYLRALPTADLDRDLIESGDRFHTIKDLLLHITDVEDHWVHYIARGEDLQSDGRFKHDWVKPQAQQYDLSWIIDYGRTVGQQTQTFLDSNPDLDRSIKLIQDDPASDTVTLDQLMWNVMTHEVRHTAQIALLIRQLGHTPPWADYLRFARPQVTEGSQVDAPDPEDAEEGDSTQG
ncbi:damage-inducible protein DinB [Deinococcus radiopugnans]|uniref:Damage-inducible protein DinB n=1 Tax=Deinococcus radiopugnans TaxID=57497 RepID=A0A0A7KFL6_9DEIO|nr:DinB family protein [Deinococcus radiopugnans]AIZ44024.1 damage-inducible protein DinB [Deinococcus radiopugnans]